MKSANELPTELVRHAQPPSGCAIALTKSKPKISGNVNWIAGTGVMDLPLFAFGARSLR
jgi:hypothetical protein